MKQLNQKIILFRAIAILLVMLGHSIIIYDPNWRIYSTTIKAPYFVLLKEIINQVQMPLFFSISGFLFYYSLQKPMNIENFVKDKVVRLLIPYIFIVLFYMDPIKILLDVPQYSFHHIPSLLKEQLMFTNNGHLWFLPCLFIIFFLMYIGLHRWHNKSNLLGLLLLLLAINLCNSKIPNIWALNTVAQYAVFFYIGFIGNKFQLDRRYKVAYILTAILLFVITLLQPVNMLRPVGILACLYLLYQIPFELKIPKVLDAISKNSYGLYLFHSPLIYITYKY